VCFLTVPKIGFSNSWPVVEKRLIGSKFWGNFGSLLAFGNVMIPTSFQGAMKWPSRSKWLIKCVKRTWGRLGRCRRHSFQMPSKPQAFPNFNECISFQTSQGRKLIGVSSTVVASKASTWAATCRKWSQSQKSRSVNWFSTQSAVMLALPIGSNMGPKGPWIADGVFGPPLFVRDFAIGH
jgi:hypothetical protein